MILDDNTFTHVCMSIPVNWTSRPIQRTVLPREWAGRAADGTRRSVRAAASERTARPIHI